MCLNIVYWGFLYRNRELLTRDETRQPAGVYDRMAEAVKFE